MSRNELRVYIAPTSEQIPDDNGIGQIVHAQYRYLPALGIELVEHPDAADVVAAHIIGDGLPRVDVHHTHGLYWSDMPHAPYHSWHHEANRRIVETARRSRVVTVPSDWVAGAFRRDMRIQPEVIGHGIDVAEWEPAAHEGYLLWNKNRPSDVCDPTPAWELAMRGVPVVSTFAPPRREVPEAMRVTGTLGHAEMKVLVRRALAYLATTPETFGIGTLEALAAGVPVLGYRWGGTADLVTHGVDGYLVEPGDVEGLMEGLEVIREHRDEMSAAARETAARYHWPAIMERYAALYRRAAEIRAAETDDVAIVITNFNYRQFVGEAIESALSQTYPCEVVVVDDGSTDGSVEVIRRLPHARLIEQPNTGVAAARNAGIAATSAAFVICLDADDRLDPTYVETLRAAMAGDPGLGVAYTGLGLLQEDGSVTPNPWPPEFDWESQARRAVPPANLVPCAAMFRRAMWERAGGYKQVYAPAEDTEFFTRGLSVGFRARRVTDAPLFHYRIHAGSASRTKEYRPIDAWHPWMRDKQYPMGAPSATPPVVRSYHRPAVSVIVPVGPGHETYLPAALDSLLGQTCRDWEVVVVDDTEGGIGDQVLRPYPFARVVETRSGGGQGAGYARNRGIERARAPLVLFLDADDYLMPDALEKMLRAHVASGGRYVYSDWLAINGETVTHDAAPEYSQGGWLRRGLHAVTALVPTAWTSAVGGFDEEMSGWEDWDFFVKLAAAGYCGVRVPEPLLGYRQHTGSRREVSLARKNELLELLRARYSGYGTGEKEMGSCCGGNGDALLAAKRAIAGGGPAREPALRTVDVSEPATVRMEYVGENVGAITFYGRRKQYRGGNNPIDRYAEVRGEDVERLEATGKWRVVAQPPPPAPNAPEPTNAREKVPA